MEPNRNTVNPIVGATDFFICLPRLESVGGRKAPNVGRLPISRIHVDRDDRADGIAIAIQFSEFNQRFRFNPGANRHQRTAVNDPVEIFFVIVEYVFVPRIIERDDLRSVWMYSKIVPFRTLELLIMGSPTVPNGEPTAIDKPSLSLARIVLSTIIQRQLILLYHKSGRSFGLAMDIIGIFYDSLPALTINGQGKVSNAFASAQIDATQC